MKESKISHRQTMDLRALVSYMEDLVISLRSGKVVIERDGQYVSLALPDAVNLELEAKEKKDKAEITLEISWRKEMPKVIGAPLIITSEEPPSAPEAEMVEETETDQDI